MDQKALFLGQTGTLSYGAEQQAVGGRLDIYFGTGTEVQCFAQALGNNHPPSPVNGSNHVEMVF
jgi:hypothetical protein